MLTSAQSITFYDFVRREATPDRLHRQRHAGYLRAAARMIAVYRRGAGVPRGELHRRIERMLESLEDCPPRRVAAFCKLLDDASEFSGDGRTAARLRKQVFSIAAEHHPLVSRAEGIFESTVDDVRRSVAEQLGRPWPEIEAGLFADVMELQRLKTYSDPWQPAELLAAYNVAQTQALLYRAQQMTVWATEDLKIILRHAKLAGLMHEIRRLRDGGYRFTFDGPASALRSTSRYGVRFARMIPKLLSCRGWRLEALIIGPRQQLFTFRLSPADGLRSILAAPEPYDSALEAEMVERWNQAPPPAWRLERESEILHIGQQICTPDFVLWRIGDPEPIYVELVGFWTPEYLRAKERQLAELASHRWIVIVPKGNSQFGAELRLPMMQLTGRFHPDSLVQLADEHYPASSST